MSSDKKPSDKHHDFDPNQVNHLLKTGGGQLSNLTQSSPSRPESVSANVDTWLGQVLGAYRITEYLNQGGMSLVFIGQRCDGQFEQKVAIKLLQTRGQEVLAQRFERERQILADLEHINIARIIDSGVFRTTPYIVMELVDGVDIARYCDNHQLTVEQRLSLFIGVTEAVQYAHSQLVLHRDIKPNNVVVGTDGIPKLLDFGIAKLIGDQQSDLTSAGSVLTPLFASPEQVLGDSIGVSSDIYQLGLLLYRLLTGTDAQAMQNASIAEVKAVVTDRDPTAPSQVMVTTGAYDPDKAKRITATRSSSLSGLVKQLHGDIDAITLKCLRKRPTSRYASVTDLLRDLENHQSLRPVSARSPTIGYRMRRFARRNRLTVGAGAMALASLMIGTAFASHGFVRAEQAARVAQTETVTAQAASDFLVGMFRPAGPDQFRSIGATAVEVLDRGRARVNSELADQPRLRTRIQLNIAKAYWFQGLDAVAIEVINEALPDRLAEYGARSEQVAELKCLLGSAQRSLGQLDAAKETQTECLQIYRELGTADRGVIAVNSSNYLGWRRVESNDSPQVQQYLDEVTRQIAGLDDAQLDETVTDNDGSDHSRLNQKTAAVLVQIRPLKPVHDSDFPIVGERQQKASLLQAQGRFSEAIDAFEELLAFNKELYGSQDAIVVDNLQNLAAAVAQSGDLVRALSLQQEALNMASVHFEAHDPSVLSIKSDLALTLSKLERLDESAIQLTEKLRLQSNQLPANHAAIGDTLEQFANFQLNRGKGDEGKQMLQRALIIARENFGSNHPRTATILRRLALAERALGQSNSAHVNIAQSVNVLRSHKLDLPADLSNALHTLADIQTDLAQPEAAMLSLKEACEIRTGLYPEGSCSGPEP